MIDLLSVCVCYSYIVMPLIACAPAIDSDHWTHVWTNNYVMSSPETHL